MGTALVADVPVWTACPFLDRVPPGLEVRRGIADGMDMLILRDPETDRHVTVQARDYTEQPISYSRELYPMIEAVLSR